MLPHPISSDYEGGDDIPRAHGEVDLKLPAGTIQCFMDLQRLHGDIFSVAVRGSAARMIVLAHPDYAQQVLADRQSNYQRFMLDGRMPLLLGSGILTSAGSDWKAQRKLLQRCFHGDALSGLIGHAARSNDALLDRWHSHAQRGETAELTREMVLLSIGMNFNAMFGSDAAAMMSAIDIDYLQRLCAPTEMDTRSSLRLLRDTKQVRRCIITLMTKRRDSGGRSSDLLGMFMEARHPGGAGMSDGQIVDEILATLTAGHETIANALESVWCAISRDRSLLQEIRRETDCVLGDSPPQAVNLASLRYTKQVIQECLRLSPPVWLISYQAQRNSRIAGYSVPAGSYVAVCTYLIHRNPAFWPTPAVFDPARFARPASEARHRYAYLPYSIGPRNCIGDDLSMLEMLLHLATVSRTFDVTHADGAPSLHASGFMLRAQSRVNVRLERRS
jgi:cytochrome P450